MAGTYSTIIDVLECVGEEKVNSVKYVIPVKFLNEKLVEGNNIPEVYLEFCIAFGLVPCSRHMIYRYDLRLRYKNVETKSNGYLSSSFTSWTFKDVNEFHTLVSVSLRESTDIKH